MAERELITIQADLRDFSKLDQRLANHNTIDITRYKGDYGYESSKLTITISGAKIGDLVDGSAREQLLDHILTYHLELDADQAEEIHGWVQRRRKELEDELVVKAKDIAKTGGI